jgi:hypothetical protein
MSLHHNHRAPGEYGHYSDDEGQLTSPGRTARARRIAKRTRKRTTMSESAALEPDDGDPRSNPLRSPGRTAWRPARKRASRNESTAAKPADDAEPRSNPLRTSGRTARDRRAKAQRPARKRVAARRREAEERRPKPKTRHSYFSCPPLPRGACSHFLTSLPRAANTSHPPNRADSSPLGGGCW